MTTDSSRQTTRGPSGRLVRWIALLLTLVVAASACGGGESTGDAEADGTTDDTAAADEDASDPQDEAAEPETSEADGTDDTDDTVSEAPPQEPTTEPATPDPTEGPTGEAASDGVPQDPQPSVHNAGTVTVSAVRCDIQGAEFSSDSSSRTIPGVAVHEDQVYLSNGDGQTLRFTADTAEGCTLTLDETWGDAGYHTPENEQDALNIARGTGRLVMSGSVFDVEVVDTLTGASYVCDVGGEVEITGDGSLGVAYFPGSAIKQVNFTDTGCTVDDPAPQAASLAYENQAITAGQFTPDGQFVTGGSLPGNLAQVISYTQDGSEVWRQGESDPDAFTDTRYGWVHAISLCGGDGLCTLDTNFRRLQVLNMDGSWVTSVDLNELHDIEGAWWEDMESDDLGRLWMPVGASREEGDVTDGFVFLVTVDGL